MNNKIKYVLVTGSAGFIGFHLTLKLIKKGFHVVGLDNLNSYYSKKLKLDRLNILKKNKKNFRFFKVDLKKKNEIDKIFKKYQFVKIFHFAAQAGVRKSIKYPATYLNNNIIATTNLFEVIKDYKLCPVILASSSSVYGNQKNNIFSTNLKTDSPIQMYAVTKKSTELIGYSYNFQYNIPVACLRFFTVYGPWGRPDMALFNFTKKILNKKTIEVYNNGKHYRDFTYIDDIISKTLAVLKKTRVEKKNKFNVYNLGNGKPTQLLKFVNIIEKNLKLKAKIKYLPKQQGDMVGTHADMKLFQKIFGKIKSTSINIGVKKFIIWYKNYYKIHEDR